MSLIRNQSRILAALATALMLTACGDDDDNNPTPPPDAGTGVDAGTGTDAGTDGGSTPVMVGEVIALTASNKLVSFDRATPGTLVGSVDVTGLGSGESLLGIDYRPADSQLYGLTSAGRIVTLAPDTGVATLKSTLAAMAGDDNPFTALSGTDFAVDFNPVADRLRVVGDDGQNLRINVDTGATTTDGAINGGNSGAKVTGAGYTNSFPETASTRLFVLDAATDTVYLQDPPNNGTLSAPAPLGVDASGVNGYDIDARTNVGYAALTVGGTQRLYRIAPENTAGAATELAAIGTTEALKGLALKQASGAAVYGLTTDSRLVRAAVSAPNTLTATVALTGVPGGETLLGIDVRPADRKMYALSSAGKLYTVDPQTGAVTAKSTLSADPADLTAPFTALSGTQFVIDFNPVADRLRVVSDTGQNLRINVDTGATTTDGDINRSPAAVVFGAAYTNSVMGTTATALFDLERNSNVLAQQNPPNNGTLVNVGALGVTFVGAAGFDIAGGDNGLPLVAGRTANSGPHVLYQVNLLTGAATFFPRTATTAEIASIGGASGPELRDIAVVY
ncbi:DUF4394 domain-containing protein [Corallococcus terminator]|uniref:DUF4394 domain-containing protein n=1 Tax=Corallococcus terminator TaxID=2316733 RepID=A0A3A8HZX1_9BACT|nr:DUF4394 domain-containing protein [Corallococcus terminator]RKG73020.1 DUF4394 domain-containing protein [Corallococcus terminator]